MNKTLKILASCAAAGAVLLGAAAVAVRVLLPPAKLKALAIAQAEKSLHRTLEVRGVEFGLLSGLRVEDLRLSESPDFSKGEFLKADALTVSPEWLPLLHGKFVARRVELDGASANVVKRADGVFNFSDLAGGAAAAPAAKSAKPAASSAPARAAAAPLALAVDSLRLRKLALHYADVRGGAKADVTVDEFKADGFGLSGAFPVSLDVAADYAAGGKRVSASLKASGTLDLGGGKPAKVVVDFTRFSLKAEGKEASGSLRVENADAPKAALKLDVPALDQKFLSALGGASVPADAALAAAKIEAALAYSAPAVDVSSFKLTAAGVELSGSASISDPGAKDPKIKLKLSSNKFPLADLGEGAAALKAFGLTGAASLTAEVTGSRSSPKASGTLGLDGVGAKYEGQTLEKTSGEIRFTQASLDIPGLTGRLNGGDFTLKVSASNPAAPVVAVSGHLSLLDLGALQKLAGAPAAPAARGAAPAAPAAPAAAKTAASPELKTTGDVTVDKIAHPNFACGKTTLTWNLTGITPDMKRLAGVAKLSAGAGQATNLLDFAAARGGMVRAMVVPLAAIQKAAALHLPGLNLPDVQNIPFTKIEGNYSASKGVVVMQPFLIDGPTLGMTTTGSVDLGAQTANLKASVKTGLGVVDLLITGPFSGLSVKPVISQEMKKNATQLLQDQGKALLNRFFHR